MFTPTIVIWLVLLMLALNVVAFVTRIIEKCRLPMTSEQHQKEPSLSYRPVNRRQNVVQFGPSCMCIARLPTRDRTVGKHNQLRALPHQLQPELNLP